MEPLRTDKGGRGGGVGKVSPGHLKDTPGEVGGVVIWPWMAVLTH